jgi:hypothetical protein
VKVFRGVTKRDYEYDVFWVAFPLLDKNNKPVFGEQVSTIELFIGFYKKEGKITWPISTSLRDRIRTLANSK